VPGQPEEKVAFGVGDAQRAGEGFDDLRRRRGGLPLFEPGQVVHRDPCQRGEFFSAQPRGTTASPDREADRRGRHAVAPATHRPTELPRVHVSTVADASRVVLPPGSHTKTGRLPNHPEAAETRCIRSKVANGES